MRVLLRIWIYIGNKNQREVKIFYSYLFVFRFIHPEITRDVQNKINFYFLWLDRSNLFLFRPY
jgi:hypothetical protein